MAYTYKYFIIVANILSAATICSLNIAPISAAAAVIDTDSPVYSNLAREVMVSGYGLQPSQTYFLWLRKPGLRNSSYTGVSFVATSTGGIPYPNVKIALDVPPALGTYTLTISSSTSFDSGSAKCHFGVFGSTRALYQRRETVKFVGGGLLPGSTIRVDIRNPADVLVGNVTAIANDAGEFEHSWQIPNNAQIGTWTISAGGTGTYDNSLEKHRADSQFGVTEASLTMSIHQQPLALYQRTETARIAFVIRYPDQSPVTTIKQGSRPVLISRAGIGIQSLPLTLIDSMNGIWVAEYVVPKNETLGRNFTFTIPAGSFDDGYGNKAPSTASASSPFEVASAQLKISMLSPKQTYEILFDSVNLTVTVRYPDGSDLRDGNVLAIFESGAWRELRPLIFQEKSRCWTLTQPLTITELLRIGTWNITVVAEDADRNTGAISIEANVRPIWLLVVAATLSILALVVAKWISEEAVLRRFIGRNARDKP